MKQSNWEEQISNIIFNYDISEKESELLEKEIKELFRQALSQQREAILKWAESKKVGELLIGETQYRYEKGNIAFVYNLALDDLIQFLNQQDKNI